MAKHVKFDETKNVSFTTHSASEYVRIPDPTMQIMHMLWQDKPMEMNYGPFSLKIVRVPARGLFAIEQKTKHVWVVSESRLIEDLMLEAIRDLFTKINTTLQICF